jgi:DNA modification methylase
LIAAQKLGRQFIGIEIDPHWVEVANAALHPQEPAATSQIKEAA